MLRTHRYLLLLVLFLTACGGSTNGTQEPAPGQTTTLPAVETATAPPVDPTPSPAPTATAVAPATPTAALWDLQPVATRSAPVTDLAITEDDIFIYPVPEIYEGDAVTFLVRPAVPDVDHTAVG